MSEKVPEITDQFLELVAQQHVGLRSYIRSIGVQEQWVDDFAQDTLMVGLREMDSFDGIHEVGSWLRGIARNLVRNELRKDARRKRILDQGLAELLVTVKQTDQNREPWQETHLEALRDCVEKLPPKSREIITNRYSGGWLSADIAAHFGMTSQSVRQSLVRIRRQLKKCILNQVVGVS